MPDLSVDICGLSFANPVLAAAGPGTRNGAMCLAAARGGAGGIVTKTVSTAPASVPRPCMSVVRGGFLNTELWSEQPVEKWLATEYPEAREAGVPVIVSLGYTAGQIAGLAPLVAPFADALELSTHYVPDDPSPVLAALAAAKAAVSVPVFVKLSPHPDIRELAVALAAAGADGLVMINSFGPCLALDLDTGLPLMGSRDGYGWLSGPAIKPLAVRCVYEAARAVSIPVIGVGGVTSGRDVAEMLMAGAAAVQVCTAAVLKGPAVYGTLAGELDRFLAGRGRDGLPAIRGLAHRAVRSFSTTAAAPEVDAGRCNRCGLCRTSCVYQAITLAAGWQVDPGRCFGCGLCVSRCPRGALRLPA